MSGDVEILVHPDGTLQLIHDDDVAELFAAQETFTRRASHVEPAGHGWTADLSPVGGPVLGPFARRGEALAAEVEWLRDRMRERRL